jgi:REP element-mobilizing transposase RayT
MNDSGENGGRRAVGAAYERRRERIEDGGDGAPPSTSEAAQIIAGAQTTMNESGENGGRRACPELVEGAVGAACERRRECNEDGGVSGKPLRKRPAHMPVIEPGNQTVIVFLTVCTKNRKPLLAKPDIHELLIHAWRKATRWSVGRYVVMPDHIHLFCSPAAYPVESVCSWTKYWKTLVSREWPRPEEHPVWQQNGWDTQLRKGDTYSNKWEYVCNNPVRCKLVARAEDWPFQGEMHSLSWHEK